MSRIDITHCDVDLSVEFDYEAAEPAQHYGDAPYPGSTESLDVYAVYVGGTDIIELLDNKTIDDIAQKVLEARS